MPLLYTIYRNIALLALGHGFGIATAVISVTISALAAASIGATGAMLTLPYGAQFAALLIVTIPLAKAIELYGRKTSFLISALIGLAGGLLGAYGIHTKEISFLFIAHFLIGIHLAAVNYYRFAAFDIADEKRRAIAMSLVVFGGTFAAFIGPFVARSADELIPFTRFVAIYVSIAVLCFVVFLSIIFCHIRDQDEKKKPKIDKTLLWQTLKHPMIIGGMLASAVGYGMMNILMITAGIQMNVIGIEFIPISYAIQMHVLAMFAPSLFMGKIIQWVGGNKVTLIGAILMMVGTLSAMIEPKTLWGYQLALIFYGLAWNMLFVGGSYLVANHASKDVSLKVQAYNNLLVGLFTMFTSAIAGYSFEQLGWIKLNQLMMGAGLILLVTLMVLYLNRKTVVKI